MSASADLPLLASWLRNKRPRGTAWLTMPEVTRSASIWLAAAFVGLGLAAGCGQQATQSRVDQVRTAGEAIPFEVCGTWASWQRPSLEEQREQWWSNLRYSGLSQESVDAYWQGSFFFNYANASGSYDTVNLSGLWTLPAEVQSGCLDPAVQDSVLKLEEAELWVLDHQVQTIMAIEDDYVIQVRPSIGTIQFVHFPRPGRRGPLIAYFVDETGRLITRIDEGNSPLWPYPAVGEE